MSTTNAQPILLNDSFSVVSYNGGHRTATGSHDPNGWVFNAFAKTDGIHSSAKSDGDVVLRYKDAVRDGDCFTLTHIIIRAPGNSNFPLKSALVWVTTSDPEVEAYTDSYVALPWGAQTVECYERAQPTKPVLGLFLNNTSDPTKNLQVVHEFNTWPSGKYIHLKFVEAHRLGAKSFIDVLYVGLVGFHGPGPKYKKFGLPPDDWNITTKEWKIIKPLHTDYQNILYEQPCLVAWYDDFREDACDKLREILTGIAELDQVKAKGLQFFLHTSEKKWHQRDDDIQLLRDIEFDMKQTMTPPVAVIIDRPNGQAYTIGHDLTVLTEANMKEFILGWVEGTAKQWRGTEEIVEEDSYPDFPHTKRVVAGKYDAMVMDKHKDVLLYVYCSETEYTPQQYEKESDYVVSGLHSVSVWWSIHKVGILLQNEPDILVCGINSHKNWVPKEFRQPSGVVVVIPRNKAAYVTYPLQSSEIKPSILLTGLLKNCEGRNAEALQQKLNDMLELERFKLFYAPSTYQEDTRSAYVARDSTAKAKPILSAEMVPKKQLLSALEATAQRQDHFHVQCEYHIVPDNGAEEIVCADWGSAHDWICCSTRTNLPLFKVRGDPHDPNATDFPIKIPDKINTFAGTVVAKWSHCGSYLATGHTNGRLVLWCVPSPVLGEWRHNLTLTKHDSVPLSIAFSAHADRVACVFEDGYVYIWKLTPRKVDPLVDPDPESIVPVTVDQLWAERVARDILWVNWSPGHGQYIVIGSKSAVMVYTMEPKIEFDGYVSLFTSPGARPMSSVRYDEIVAIHWCHPQHASVLTKPGLLVVFKNGNCQLMTKWSEPKPIIIETGLMATTAGWSPNGNFLAIGGTFLKESSENVDSDSSPVCAIKLFSVTGFLRGYCELPLEGAFGLQWLSWNQTSDRIIVCADNQLWVLKVRGKLRRIVATKTSDPMLAVSYIQPGANGNNNETALALLPNKEGQLVNATAAQSRCLSPDSVGLVENEGEYSIFINKDLTGSYLNERQIAELFADIDTDGNGWITKGEFRRLYDQLEKFGVEENEDIVDRVLKGYNMMGDDKLSFDEFAILMLKLAQQ
eukprot:TRINITY_DN67145_c5_g4_i2.p1 TRINITY_DN67145_c5_g4~~TRINITY_DN67145_c5_g4_i2.p1  ORF type:complete len:1077 (+),score=78.67 TRINITY_DN67145_c5_g4_i2:54-3284(+)